MPSYHDSHELFGLCGVFVVGTCEGPNREHIGVNCQSRCLWMGRFRIDKAVAVLSQGSVVRPTILGNVVWEVGVPAGCCRDDVASSTRITLMMRPMGEVLKETRYK